MKNNTIAAIATAPGSAGVAIIRISGDGAEGVLRRVFSHGGEYLRAKLYFGSIKDGEELLDNGMAVLFRAPKSYTGEDVAEIQCHGSAVGVARVLGLILKSGAVLAQPGEFTKRAFLNGKLDLTQAEAVCDYISAVSSAGAKNFARQMEGELKNELLKYQDKLTDIIAEVEAAVEYPEEDLELEITKNALPEIESLQDKVVLLEKTYTRGRLVKEGINIAIAGKPNVGKSSLLNALAGKERAIVSERAGTTRDTIEHSFELDGIAINLVDTAGIRSTDDMIEAEGVKRSKIAANEANIVILMLDFSQKFTEEDDFVCEGLKHIIDDVIIVWNKIDACEGRSEVQQILGFEQKKAIFISAKTGEGINLLKEEILKYAKTDENESVVITNERHRELLKKAADNLQEAINSLKQEIDMDCITIDLNLAWQALGELTGNTVSEDIIDRIFSKFCLGK